MSRHTLLLKARINRDYVFIASDILSCAIRGAKKTELMNKARLSYAQTNKYMRRLMRLELLEVSNNDKKTVYKTTTKGKEFMERFDQLAKLLD